MSRESLDRLLAFKPGVDVVHVDAQPAQLWRTRVRDEHDVMVGVAPTEVGGPGPWVCVDFADGERFAIWKATGNAYRLDEHGAVEEDPIDFDLVETELERLRRINRELVRDHNAMLQRIARQDAPPTLAASAIQVAQAALADAQSQLDSALGIARINLDDIESCKAYPDCE